MQTLNPSSDIHKQAHDLVARYNFLAFEDPLGQAPEFYTAHVLEVPDFVQTGRTREEALQRLRAIVSAFVKKQLMDGRDPPHPLVRVSKAHLKAWILIPEGLVAQPIPALVGARCLDDARYYLLKAWGLAWKTPLRAYRQPQVDNLLQIGGVVEDPLIRRRAGLS